MKKKIILAALLIAAALCGCADSAKTIEGSVSVKESAGDAGKEAGEGTQTAVSPGTEAEETQYRGYAFLYNGVTIEMDAEASRIVDQLGEPAAYFEAPSCAFEGIDKVYTYNSFELDTYPTDGQDYVSSVVFKDDTIATMEGVSIGDSADKMEEVYGTGWSDDNGMKVYGKDDMKLCFIFQGDKIVSIEYRSGVLD